jgi:hypothetical protein
VIGANQAIFTALNSPGWVSATSGIANLFEAACGVRHFP